MKRRVVLLLTGLFAIFFVLSPCVSAEEYPLVYDEAGLFSEQECWVLEEKTSTLSANYGVDIMITTTSDTKGKPAQEYANDFFDSVQINAGMDKSGVMLLIDMDNREVYISTYGSLIDIYTDARINTTLDRIMEEMSDGDYTGAAEVFLVNTETYLDLGSPTSGDDKPKNYVWIIIISLASGVAVGAGACLAVTVKYKRLPSKNALASIRCSEPVLATQADRFVTEHTSCVKIQPQHTSSSHSSRSSSSTHRSSSRRTHGGGGRKF